MQSISASFLFREPDFNYFSRAIAYAMVQCISNQTSRLHPYRFVNPST